jgi:hypothetical protein
VSRPEQDASKWESMDSSGGAKRQELSQKTDRQELHFRGKLPKFSYLISEANLT